MTKAQEAIDRYSYFARALVHALEESNAAVIAFHRNAVTELISLHRGEAFDLTDAARAALQIHRARQAEREAVTRAEEAKIAALEAILAEKQNDPRP